MPSRARDALLNLRRHLDEQVFKGDPEPASRFGRGEAAALVGGLLILATVLQLLRIGPDIAVDSLWAEDGPIFLQGALQHGFWTDLWTTYGGYLVFVPRLIGLLGSLFPLNDAAAVIALTSAFVTALGGFVIWIASAAHIRDPWLRGTLAVLAVLAPTAAAESVASASYVLWFMLLPTFWLLVWRPRATGGAVLGGGFVLLTALSTPATWFFAPLAALRGLAIRDRRDAIIFGSWALGSLAQVPAILLHNEKQAEPAWSHDIWTAYLQRVLDGAALGERAGGVAWELLGWVLLIGLVTLAARGLYVGLRGSGPSARWLAAIAVPTSIVMFVVSAYQRAVGSAMAWPAGDHFGSAGRYTIVPALLLVSVALVLVDEAARRRPALGRRLVGATVAVLVAGMATSFYVRNTTYRGTPAWGDALDAAAVECRDRGLAEASVPISPPGFRLAVPCDELDSN